MKVYAVVAGLCCLAGCQLTTPAAQQAHCPTCTAAEATPTVALLPDEQQLPQHLQYLPGGNYLPPAIARPVKPLSDYAADLALQLMLSMQFETAEPTIAISSFVLFDSQLDESNALGNQLAEHLYVQLQRLGVKVADIKLARQIRVTPRGDFVFSRGDYLDMQQQAAYVLSGTMLQDNAGIVVNARVMHLLNKTVIAGGQIHIPQFVLATPLARQAM